MKQKILLVKQFELDFKIPYESWENMDDIITSRKQLAEDLLVQAQSNPELFAALGQSLQDQSVLYFKQEWLTLEELPLIYQSNPALYTNRVIWSIASQLTEWVYRDTVWSMSWTVEWRTISKINAINTKPWSGDADALITYDIEDIVVSKTPNEYLQKILKLIHFLMVDFLRWQVWVHLNFDNL
jgi:hypothetical protein